MQINIDLKMTPEREWFIKRLAWNFAKCAFLVSLVTGWFYGFIACIMSNSAVLTVGYIAISITLLIATINTFHDRFMKKIHGRD